MSMLEAPEAEILSEVAGMLRAVIGEEWAQETEITMDTTFSEDLELESIEIVSLAEKVQERYGETVDFPSWLAAMELDDIINLKVGDLVRYIAECQ